MLIGVESWPIADFIELQPQFTKHGITVAPEAEEPKAQVERILKAVLTSVPDCRIVVDIRTNSVRTMTELGGGYTESPPYGAFIDAVVSCAGEFAGIIDDWEIWGEWNCPHTNPGDINYSDLMAELYPRVKEEAPDCRIWTGGHGVDFGPRGYQDLVRRVGNEGFDVNCLHPFITLRNWPEIEDSIRIGFERYRMSEIEAGIEDPKPVAMTEFHFPTTPDDVEINYTSKVTAGMKVKGVPEKQAARWLDGCLAIFEELGVIAVQVTSNRNNGYGNHWGKKIGLKHIDGTKKPSWDVVDKWIKRAREKASG